MKQTDKVGRPDIDSFEAMMARADRTKGFFMSFDYSSDAMHEIDAFFRKSSRISIPPPWGRFFWMSNGTLICSPTASVAPSPAAAPHQAHHVGPSIGSENENVLPPPLRCSAQIRPPCPSMMHLEMYRPRPTPPRRWSGVS